MRRPPWMMPGSSRWCCRIKWLLSPQTERLLSFGVRPPIKPSLSGAWNGVPPVPRLSLGLPPPVAAGAVPCTTWDIVIISCSSSALRSPIAVSAFEVRSIEVRLFAEDIRPTLTCPQEEPCYLFYPLFGALGTNRLVLGKNSSVQESRFCV